MKTIAYLKYRIFAAAAFVASLLFTAGCSGDLLTEHPETQLTADQVYSTEEGFELGLNGLYSLARQEREGYGYTDSFGATGLYALMNIGGTDNYNCGAGASGEFSAIYKNWATANVPTDKSLKAAFSWLYKTVLAANTIIGRVGNPDIAWSSDETPLRVEAEARLIRAWAYRHLTYLWGKVPLSLVETTGENFRTDWVREEVSVVRAQIIEDLKFAADHMGWMPSQVGRATKGVALTYLAEMYLAEAGTGSGPFDEELLRLAWEAANKCITEGPYRLIRERMDNSQGCAFMDMFSPSNVNIESGNTEALWVMQWEKNVVGGGNNLMRFSLRPKFDTADKLASGITISYEDESRGGRGFARAAITKWALELYDKSSDYAAGIIDDRGSEYTIAKYYVLTDKDTFSGVNAYTGEPWKIGDRVFIGASKDADAGNPEVSTLYGFAGLKSGEKEGDNNNWPYTLKYSFCDSGYPKNNESHNDQVYMRLAETYLLRAEAAYKRGLAGDAANDINELRTRAHALTVSESDVTLDLILEERSRELLGEEQRRYTLRRTLDAPAFVEWITARNGKDKGLSERDYLFPIPQSVIDANVSRPMEQNPGFTGSGSGSN